jgi:hypothetical protein
MLLEVGDRLCSLLNLSILCLNGFLEMHYHVDLGVHLLKGEVYLLAGIVQPVLGLAKAAVRDLQLEILLHRLTCPMIEKGIL